MTYIHTFGMSRKLFFCSTRLLTGLVSFIFPMEEGEEAERVTEIQYVFVDSKTKKRKDKSFIPDDPEPWVIRGGICGEMQVIVAGSAGSLHHN